MSYFRIPGWCARMFHSSLSFPPISGRVWAWLPRGPQVIKWNWFFFQPELPDKLLHLHLPERVDRGHQTWEARWEIGRHQQKNIKQIELYHKVTVGLRVHTYFSKSPSDNSVFIFLGWFFEAPEKALSQQIKERSNYWHVFSVKRQGGSFGSHEMPFLKLLRRNICRHPPLRTPKWWSIWEKKTHVFL